MIFSSGTTVHLDVCSRGDYDTGIFACNFIRRGERYGLRIVGSLKACDRCVHGPEVSQVHPGLFPFVLDYPERAESGLARAASG